MLDADRIAAEFSRLPPHDLDAERAALGSLMLAGDDKSLFEATRRPLRTESFYQPDHGIYFDAICRLAKADKVLDAITVRAELIRAGLFDEVGGNKLLSQILQSVPSAAHGPHYAEIVQEKYVLREIIRSANDAIRRAYEPAKESRGRELAGTLLRELTALACTGLSDKIHRLADVLVEVASSKDDAASRRIPTGLWELDETIGGIPKGNFTIIGARPRVGKSQLCKQIVLNAARRDVVCGIVAIEESRQKIAQNYLSNASGITNSKIAYGTACEEEWVQIIQAMPGLSSLPIHIADAPVKLSDVEAAISAMVLDLKCELVVVDYLQLIDPEEESNENREITKISRTLKQAFKRLDVAGIAPAQLNRGSETGTIRKPTLRDLRGSGSLEQDGDLILLLHREDVYHESEPGYMRTHQLQVLVSKNKVDASGEVPLYFDGRTQSVRDWNQPAKNPFPPAPHVRAPQATTLEDL